ncbi:MAG: hypothetical protein WBE28_10520 [bacterium]
MLSYLQDWLARVKATHGVDPEIFAIIYFGGVIPFWLSIYKIIAGIRKRNMTQVRTFSIILGMIILAPFTYVAIFGRNLPFWFWIVAVLVIAYSTHSVIRRLRSVREER